MGSSLYSGHDAVYMQTWLDDEGWVEAKIKAENFTVMDVAVSGMTLDQTAVSIVEDLSKRIRERGNAAVSPFVTLTYAQTLNGSIAARPGERTELSGPQSMTMTHMLRSEHDAIMVGINTVIADNPRLTVRLAQGNNPRPVVLDSELRTPTTCALFTEHRSQGPIIFTSEKNAFENPKAMLLRNVGALILPFPASFNSARIDLRYVLNQLQLLGIRSVMVEGGASVISSVLQAQLAHQIIVTISPQYLDGLPCYTSRSHPAASIPTCNILRSETLGRDLVLVLEQQRHGGE